MVHSPCISHCKHHHHQLLSWYTVHTYLIVNIINISSYHGTQSVHISSSTSSLSALIMVHSPCISHRKHHHHQLLSWYTVHTNLIVIIIISSYRGTQSIHITSSTSSSALIVVHCSYISHLKHHHHLFLSW